MQGVHTVEQVRAAEATLMARLPDGALMQRAAAALAVECARLLGRVYGSEVVLLVGSGANGGDALFAGARLAAAGARVRALLAAPDRAHAAGLAALRRAGGRVGADPTVLDRADVVLDGLVGIGGRGGLREPGAGWAQRAAARRIVAVDLPSGVDADTGAVDGPAVRAHVTVTFGALKTGLVAGPGVEHAGRVRLVDIGLALPPPDAVLLEHDDVADLLPVPTASGDKYTRGVAGVIAGSEAYPGAGVLATGAAVHAGAGMVRYLGLAADAIRAAWPEVVVQDGARPADARVQAWVVGSGLGTGDAARALLAEALAADVPVLVDADGITLLGQHEQLRAAVAGRTAPTVLTPHDREFARVAGEVGPDRLGAARRAAAELGVTMLLKGNATVVADPDGRAWINTTGTPWLGTAGSGDVLSGVIGSLLACGLAPGQAAAAGAYLHGVAGQLAASAGPPSARDVLDALRSAVAGVVGDAQPPGLAR